MKRFCDYCNQWIDFKNYQSFGGHRSACKCNPNLERKRRMLSKYMTNFHNSKDRVLNCEKCGKTYVLHLSERRYKEGKYRKHCSYKCSNSRVQTKEMNDARRLKQAYLKVCPMCKKDHKITKFRGNCCSENCLIEYDEKIKVGRIERARVMRIERRKKLDEKQKYYEDSRFKFNIYHYSEEFDLHLIKNHGWYKATNRGNNIDGIVRDHMISIQYGFENNVHSEIISHPANCKLMHHIGNCEKNTHCSITIENLIERVKVWNKKYGPVV